MKRRTTYDLAMIREIGYCNGIENYSRHFSGKKAGEAPDTLLSYFPHKADGSADFLTIIDESHVSVPQIGAMYAGDASRKQSLVDFGFRLPSAKDNRPLKFEEFEDYLKKNRPRYNENDRDMTRIIISILPLNPIDVNKEKEKAGVKTRMLANQPSFFKNQKSDFFSRLEKEKKTPTSSFSQQTQKFKIPAKKPTINRGWMNSMYRDFMNKQKNNNFSKEKRAFK